MKRIYSVSLIAGLMALGMAAQAEAVPSLQIVGCQGTTCVAGVIQTVGTINFTNVDVGDYNVSGSGSAVENPGQSNVQQTTINVSRTGTSSPLPLEVYVVATTYNLPNPPGTLDSTHGASFTDLNATNVAAPVDFQGWISLANSTLTGVPAVPGPNPLNFVGAVGIPAGTTTNGEISCTPVGDIPVSCSVNGNEVAIAGGTVPFSLITRTTFNIPTTAGNVGDTYGSTSQATVLPAAIPEPASMLLLGTGLFGLAGAARRRRNKKS